MTQNELLKSFLNMEVGRDALKKVFGDNLLGAVTDYPVTVTAHDVAAAINKYMAGGVSQDALVDWVNTIWFTDLYEYDDAESDCIGNVIAVLETLDEDGVVITQKEWQEMLMCLKTNVPGGVRHENEIPAACPCSNPPVGRGRRR